MNLVLPLHPIRPRPYVTWCIASPPAGPVAPQDAYTIRYRVL